MHNIIPGLFQTAKYSAAMLAYFIDFLETPNDLTRRSRRGWNGSASSTPGGGGHSGRMDGAEIGLRRAGPADEAAVAEVWLRSFDAALPTVRRAHTADQVRGWVRDVLVPRRETWVAEGGGTVVGMMVLDGDLLDQL